MTYRPRSPRDAFARLGFLLAIGVAMVFAVIGPSHARGRWYGAETVRRSVLIDTVAEFERHLGQGNFTGRPGSWCAWAVSAILVSTGHRPLASGLAASALAYGPRVASPKRGDLVIVATRAGRYGHVGIVVADHGATITFVSGNWSRKVSLATISRRSVTAFIRT